MIIKQKKKENLYNNIIYLLKMDKNDINYLILNIHFIILLSISFYY
jgi:hypothetical protein